MTSFLNFHAFAAARGDGLRPELHALFERSAAAPRTWYGPVGSGFNIRAGCARARKHVALSANFSPPDTRGERNIGAASSKTCEVMRIVRLVGLSTACLCVGGAFLCEGCAT
jgi:hypothetical protein